MPAQEFTGIGSEGVIGMMFQAMEQTQRASWVSLIANEFTSTQATETYEGIGTVPMLREWLGGKQAHSFSKQSLTISNKDWESTLRVNVKDLRRDKTGFLQARIGELTQRAQAHDQKLLSTLIETGNATTNGVTYDAKALFATNHSVGSSGTTNNKISVDISALPTGDTIGSHGSTTAPSVGEAALVIQKGIKQLLGFKDDKGEPINEMMANVLVMVPVGLSDAFEAALSSVFLAQGMSNPTLTQSSPSGSRITKQIAVNARLTWTDKIAIFRTDNPIKSLITQLEVGPMFKGLAEGSDYEFTENAHLYSVEKSGNVGYGRFDQCVEVTMT